MNSLNLRQVCGGDTIKQADFGSELAFELLDEQYVKFREPLGESAKVILKKDNTAIYQKSVPIAKNTVSFKFDKILPVGSYVLEIIAGDYVFPSNNRVIITVEQTYGDFEPEYLVKVSYEELKADVDDLKSRVQSLESDEKDVITYDDSKLVERIENLENKEDHDTIYDDTDIKQSIANVDNKMSGLSEKVTALEKRPIVDTALTERVEALERKEDKDTVYDDTDIKERIETLEAKPDNDTIYDDTGITKRIEKIEASVTRRAPTGYTLDRTTTPWTIWFDNGCGLQMPEYSTTATVYGYGFGASYTDNNITTYPIIPNIIRASNGSLTIEKIKTIKGGADFWSPSIKIINPIRNRDDYDWENARFNTEALSNNSYQYVRQQYFIRTMYELGIWSDDDVLSLGAVKK
ncbi:hypothetical protein V4S29_06460 [Enterococcus cecorum]|uniref:hypothetical protein n=1 Tax=Enterococcus cecorum TaxID=44008 RepID=UPI003263BBB3